jgi:hypothetical protein
MKFKAAPKNETTFKNTEETTGGKTTEKLLIKQKANQLLK